MSEIAKRQVAAIRQYQAEHPEVDWDTHVVYFRPTGPIADREWVAVGHQPKDERDAALDRCCCHPDLPRHHAWR